MAIALRKLFIILLLAIIGSVLPALGQSNPELPQMIPPSPEASALGKYGEIPVGKSTGVPNISVPVYEIKTSRFNLPISLSYHASGIKVDQTATWVGLGWSLNAGGVITRTILGEPDYITSVDYIPRAEEISFPEDQDWLEAVLTGGSSIDTEPDNFYYNFLSHSGKFIFGQNGEPITIITSPLKIDVDGSDFVITDQHGNVYKFADKESVVYKSYPAERVTTQVSSWYLTSMISADRSDTISFHYEEEPQSSQEYSYGFSQVLGPTSTLKPGTPCGDGTHYDPVSVNISYRDYFPLRIKTIKFRGGKVDFVSKAGRKDANSSSLDSVVVYSYDFKEHDYTFVKAFKLEMGYFYSSIDNLYTNSDIYKYRLRLDKIIESDKSSKDIRTHSFNYNEQQLPPVNNLAQDYWGFYNGQKGNTNLIEEQTVTVPTNLAPKTYTIGGAIRTPSKLHMKAGMLTKVHYPTRGYSEFEYEPHRYVHGKSKKEIPKSVSVYASEMVGRENQDSEIFDSEGKHDLQLLINISKLPNLDGDEEKPFVRLTQISTGKVINFTYADSNGPVAISKPISLAPGKYELYAMAKGHAGVSAAMMITYKIYSEELDIREGMGLRIRSIKNFDSDGEPLYTDLYEYGSNGTGAVLSPISDVMYMNFKKKYSYNKKSGIFCTIICHHERTVYSSSTSYPLSTFSGSPIIYPFVSKYRTDNNNRLGKTTFSFNFETAMVMPAPPAYKNGLQVLSNSWANGKIASETHYRYSGGSYIRVSGKRFSYRSVKGPEGRGLKIGRTIEHMGCWTAPRKIHEYYYFDYPIFTGVKLPSQTTETLYDDSGENKLIETTTDYYYDNLEHLQPTRVVTTTSKGEEVTKHIRYPHEMVAEGRDANGIYGEMVARNMVAALVEEETRKGGKTVRKRGTDYYSPHGQAIVPHTLTVQAGENLGEIRLRYHKYDRNGNPLTLSKEGGTKISYQWGYDGSLPIAECKNAADGEFFYTGFEEDGEKGDARTGSCHSGGARFTTGDKVAPGLNGKAYKISYWYKDGGGWAFSGELPYMGQELTGTLDDIRIYPDDAQMTTYTYHPLNGATSATDANGITTFYEYDGLGRLEAIKDQDGNILRHLKYNYQSEETF